MDTLKAKIRHVPDFPKPGILFYDITTLLRDAAGTWGAAFSPAECFGLFGAEAAHPRASLVGQTLLAAARGGDVRFDPAFGKAEGYPLPTRGRGRSNARLHP
mgnify:CR=1 FL=1